MSKDVIFSWNVGQRSIDNVIHSHLDLGCNDGYDGYDCNGCNMNHQGPQGIRLQKSLDFWDIKNPHNFLCIKKHTVVDENHAVFFLETNEYFLEINPLINIQIFEDRLSQLSQFQSCSPPGQTARISVPL